MHRNSIRFVPSLIGALFLGLATFAPAASAADDTIIPGRYIVVFEDSVEHPGNLAEAQTERQDGELGFVYRHALEGYSAELSRGAVEALRRNPRVKYVAPERRVEIAAQTTPTGIDRVFASANAALDIDGVDDVRVNADVAVIDTGIDLAHPDLNVVSRTNCVPPGKLEEPEAGECSDGTGTDDNGHGTHVAGTIGALDNSWGVVGVAPGARLWAVKVLTPSEGGAAGPESWIVAGIDWVTAHAGQIEVANMSLGCRCEMPPVEEAIEASVQEGVVYAVAAGNSSADSTFYSPAGNPDAITVSALADYDGEMGGEAESTCADYGPDDNLASFSNYGEQVDLAAPGVCILSTLPGGEYGALSGTSMASPHVAGAAAVLASQSNPETKGDVEAVRQTLVDGGSLAWLDTARDTAPEPALYLGDAALGTEVATSRPMDAGAVGITVHGAVNARGLKTTYRFEYGETTAYGQSTPAVELSAGSKYAKVSAVLKGLNERTTYHYRLVATNSEGTVTSGDRQFTTRQTPPAFAFSFGSYGSEAGQFTWGSALTVDTKSNVWVADFNEHRIQRFNEKGEYLSQLGSHGSGNGQLEGPEGVAVGPNGVVWVADTYNNRVQRFNEKGEYLGQFGSFGNEDGQLIAPSGIAWSSGSIWVADSTSRIQKFSEKGEYLGQLGSSEGEGDGEFFAPLDLAWGPEGNIFVADGGNCRVQRFSVTGEYLSEFSFDDEGKLVCPLGIAVDSEGDVLVTDTNSGQVKKFTGEGEFLAHFGASGSGEGELGYPVGIATDPAGDIYVADAGNQRVSVWDRFDPPTATTEAASGLTGGKATLNGTIDPRGIATSYRFEYGTTTSYGTKVPLSAKAVGSGTEGVEVSEAITGLKPQTTYHFRLVAIYEGGSVNGSDLTFTTPAPEWSAQTMFEPSGATVLAEAVSCSSAEICTAVGGYEEGSEQLPFAGRWDGSEWIPQAMAKPSGVLWASVRDVSCPAAAVCMAVGEYVKSGSSEYWPFAELWNGSEWALQSLPNPPELPSGATYQLKGVSCASATACTVVGEYANGAGKHLFFAERWDGSKWTAQSVPAPSGATSSGLNDVSCAYTGHCTAVGKYVAGGTGTQLPLAVRWDGSKWSTQSMAVPSGAVSTEIDAVSCSGPSQCMAIGRYETEEGGASVAELWDGSKWAVQSLPEPSGGEGGVWSSLNDLSCSLSGVCIAVGEYVTGPGNWLPAAQHWDGSKWTARLMPALEGALESHLAGVACSTSAACTAVGTSSDGSESSPLVERWE